MMSKRYWYCVEYRKQGRVIQERYKTQAEAWARVQQFKKTGFQVSGGRIPRRPFREAMSAIADGFRHARNHLTGSGSSA